MIKVKVILLQIVNTIPIIFYLEKLEIEKFEGIDKEKIILYCLEQINIKTSMNFDIDKIEQYNLDDKLIFIKFFECENIQYSLQINLSGEIQTLT